MFNAFWNRTEPIVENSISEDVIDCRNGKNYKIWAIRNDSTGFPHFLIYDENQWKWQSAKHFKPIAEV